MKFDPTLIAAGVAFIGSVVSVVLTARYAARSARQAQETAQREANARVEADAFKRARENYDAALAEQEKRIVRLRGEMDENRKEYRDDAAEFRRRIESLQRDLRALGEWARPLLRAARAAGIKHPDPPVWLDSLDDGPEGIL